MFTWSIHGHLISSTNKKLELDHLTCTWSTDLIQHQFSHSAQFLLYNTFSTLHSIHYIHYITLHSLHYIPYIKLHYITFITLHYIHYITLYYTTLFSGIFWRLLWRVIYSRNLSLITGKNKNVDPTLSSACLLLNSVIFIYIYLNY